MQPADFLNRVPTRGGRITCPRGRGCLLLVTQIAGTADAAVQEQTDALCSLRGGHSSDIYSVRPDGTGIRRLTTHANRKGAPAWSVR